MKVWYSGFNLYNQFHISREHIVNDFSVFKYGTIQNLVFSHTYIAAQNANTITFYGRVSSNLSIQEVRNISQIAAVDNITYILYNDGTIKKVDTASGEITDVPNFLQTENPGTSDYITKIACGSKMNVAVSYNNDVYNIPNKIEYNGKRVKDVASGHEHCLILDNYGNVYSFGNGLRGQLGHGALENLMNPTLIDALAGVKINKIAAGGWHSCAVSDSGDLYTWGWNRNGQLAVPTRDPSVFATPQLINFQNDDYNVNNVACGSNHTVILVGSQVYGAGWNKYKQLGSISNENIYEFKLLKNFCFDEILSVTCGPWCTAVITK
ncbi:regulator of chromosome condensation (rcc1) repeat [Holotrichia oblita]|uniref:Regulator of chromosome condensation (Rcc1) repeat n=1 Tax=Holotrichia oblita TaxID=644536 RepID=A0ACB9T4X8_HOLOL|nr:regulator of chromosome condensation (rcc1) repeat [Holotrichia oblita]